MKSFSALPVVKRNHINQAAQAVAPRKLTASEPLDKLADR